MHFCPIDKDQAAAVLKILQEECGFPRNDLNDRCFIRTIQAPHPTEEHICHEYRFCGALGFGGKFRNNGNNNNIPHVDCYREDQTPKRQAMIAAANKRLRELFAAKRSDG
jgi:hypothetical protein